MSFFFFLFINKIHIFLTLYKLQFAATDHCNTGYNVNENSWIE